LWQCTAKVQSLLFHSQCSVCPPCCWTMHHSRRWHYSLIARYESLLHLVMDTTLELLDCSKSSSAIHRLLKGTSNSVIGGSMTLGSHVAVRQAVLGRVWWRAVLLQGPHCSAGLFYECRVADHHQARADSNIHCLVFTLALCSMKTMQVLPIRDKS